MGGYIFWWVSGSTGNYVNIGHTHKSSEQEEVELEFKWVFICYFFVFCYLFKIHTRNKER
jgi:hypothetical protein